MSATPPAIPRRLADALRGARRIAVLTGAGISAESGVPTFRDAQTGLWARYRAEDLATPEAFRRDPTLVWRWYRWRRELVAWAQPNAGHRALVTLEARCPDFTLTTQNVDGLHRRAGSTRVAELHGNLWRARCAREDRVVDLRDDGGEASLPRCPHCGALLRPDVVWFGEMLPAQALATATEAARASEVFLSIGTSARVHPAAELPLVARSAGALVVEINPEATAISALADAVLRASAAVAVPALVAVLDD